MTAPSIPAQSTVTSPQVDGRAARRWVSAAVVATVAGFAFGLGYVMVEGVFAALSDLGAVAFAVTLLPVAYYLHQKFRVGGRTASAAVWTVAVVGLTLMAVSGATLTLLDLTTTQTTLPVLDVQHLGIFFQGAWMIGVGLLGLRRRVFRSKTSYAALVGGIGYAAGAPVSLWMGFETPLFYAAFLVALAGFLAWALWLRNDFVPRGTGRPGVSGPGGVGASEQDSMIASREE